MLKVTCFVGCVGSLAIALMLLGAPPLPSTEDGGAAELDASRLLGKAYYENDKYAEAAEAYRRCTELAQDSAVDHFNLGLVQLRAQEHQKALDALTRAHDRDPDLLAVHYVRGIVFKREALFDRAVESLEHVVARDPRCRGAHYNLGVCYKALKQYENAIRSFRRSVELSPDEPSGHYQLISLCRRIGDMENAERHKEIFVRVKSTVDDAHRTPEAQERSVYSRIIDVPRLTSDLAAMPPGSVHFTEATASSNLRGATALGTSADQAASARRRGGAVVGADYDADHDLDLYFVNAGTDEEASANRLWCNVGGGRFVDLSAEAGVADPGFGMDAAFGDYDNDGSLDLYVVNRGPNVLYRNQGDGTFVDVSAAAGVGEPNFGRTALLMDYDHDNDLDIFVANESGPAPQRDPAQGGGEANTLLRNRGNGTFAPQTDEAGLLLSFARTLDAIYADFDGDHDTDLLVLNADEPAEFFLNSLQGRFVLGGAFSPPLAAGLRAAAEGDFNRDGRSDCVVATGESLLLYTNDGQAGFTGFAIDLPGAFTASDIDRIEVFDHDNDGWSDLLLLLAAERPLRLLAGAGPSRFRDVSAATGLDRPFGEVAGCFIGDIDDDGDEDLVLQTRAGEAMLLRNDDKASRHWLDVHLAGKKVNRSGFGAVVEIAGGGHYQRQTCRTGRVHFGLGGLERVDVVRVTWPNGVAQNVIEPAIDGELTIEEHVRVSASCAFLYCDGGRGLELVNEILGIGPLGVPIRPGRYHEPDCTELTKIESDQLVPRDGFYELRLTEELRELAYVDQATLRVVDHPAELEIVPNEMFTAPPFPEDRLFAVGDRRPPRSAVDDRGTDVLGLVRERDGRFPVFPVTAYEGLAEPHALTLDLGPLAGAEEIMLFLDAWIYWPESSTVMAVAQDPRFDFAPLALEVRDDEGNWRTAIASIGLPTSKGMVVPVDLTGRFVGADHHVRLSTNLCVYFDRIFVSTHDEAARCRVTELPVARTDLHYRGFSSLTRSALGFERFDYDEVSPTGSWSPPSGMLTRYGDVTELLAGADDMYVILGAGDEMTMWFDATGLAAVPRGWVRDFVFFADGWVKDGDLNTKFSETVTPLPFHGMSGYPYPEAEGPAQTSVHRQYLRRYNTRPSRSTVGELSGSRERTQLPSSRLSEMGTE